VAVAREDTEQEAARPARPGPEGPRAAGREDTRGEAARLARLDREVPLAAAAPGDTMRPGPEERRVVEGREAALG
jgi:hypothetical protein